MLENGSDLHVNRCQKIRHYHARSTEEKEEEKEEKRMSYHDFYFSRSVHKLHYYSDVIHSLDWKSAVQHNGGVQNA